MQAYYDEYCGAINFRQVLKIASFATPLAVAIFCTSLSWGIGVDLEFLGQKWA